ncbi:MAG: hypothetical protein PHD01_07190 [Geobacteraceae bacterium]|nr:hypothetical protein [Geobacteraceae bacterium]
MEKTKTFFLIAVFAASVLLLFAANGVISTRTTATAAATGPVMTPVKIAAATSGATNHDPLLQ